MYTRCTVEKRKLVAIHVSFYGTVYLLCNSHVVKSRTEASKEVRSSTRERGFNRALYIDIKPWNIPWNVNHQVNPGYINYGDS